MKKQWALLLTLLLLCSCSSLDDDSSKENAGNSDSSITLSTEEPRSKDSDSDNVLDPYTDVRGIDESIRLNAGEYLTQDMITYWFNQDTIFEGNEELAAQIIENGKDPGLSVLKLHEQGITGENVTVAIIDQPLLLDHPEYIDKIQAYHTVGFTDHDSASSMHGSAVTSLLPGNTIGTAPGVKLYCVALKFWDRNAPELGAQALDWLIEQNKELPQSEKIRAVSISADFTNAEYFDHHEKWDAAVKRAQDEGILILDCRQEYETCAFWLSYFDPVNRDDITLSRIGNPSGNFSACPAQALGTPVGYRTTAEVYRSGKYAYSYDAEGGRSWVIPYGTGVLILGWQINPSLSGQELIELMQKTAYIDMEGNRFLNPSSFIDAVKETLPS